MKKIRGNRVQKFRSKKDWWLVAFLICLSGLLIQLLLTMHAKGNISAYPIHTTTYILTIAFIWWPVLNTQYVIDGDYLKIKSMFFKWKIKLSDIQKISKTTNSASSPALSLDRLRIDYIQDGKAKFVLVSPKDQQNFVQSLGFSDSVSSSKA